MNRRERRNLRKEVNIFSDVISILKQYFPELTSMFERLTDVRNQSYVKYSMSVIFVTRLLGLLCGKTSMRNLTESMNTDICIKNISKILEIELEEIPHYDTINDVFEQVEVEELRDIQKYMINRIIRSKMFEKYRCMNRYYQVVIDGTHLVTFKEKHCKNCLKRVHNRGNEDEYTQYYHYVLEAKLVVGEIVISLDTEFVENEKEDVSKQDCEIKAFYRMVKRIKRNYPKMRIIITGDALYGKYKIMEKCQANGWEYIIRLKENLPSLVEEIRGLEKSENTEEEIKYWNQLEYGLAGMEKRANVIKYNKKEGNKTTEFMWITSITITESNKKELVYFGRQRWRIENEGFNVQKTKTFNIEHMYSKNYNAMKVHYFLIQFAHTLRQLLEKGIKYVMETKMSIKEVSDAITQTLTKINLTVLRKIQLRFNIKLII